MNAKNSDRYKMLLLTKKREISVSNSGDESLIPSAGGWQGDQVDQANALAEADLQILLHQTDGPLLRAIDGALARIRSGTFGTCEVCGDSISRARLEAVPWTRHCLDCKKREAVK
jgi:DnaK suppressor protein